MLLEILGYIYIYIYIYMIVFDDIWDWYLKLKQKQKHKSISGDGYGLVIITTSLPHKETMMVGHCHLYHIQPPSSIAFTWRFEYQRLFGLSKKYKSKMVDEVIERCDNVMSSH